MYNVSIVIPAFNEGQRLPDFIGKLVAEIDKTSFSVEVVVVDDGSSLEHKKNYRELMQNASRKYVRLIENDINAGKGAALKQGLLSSQGKGIGSDTLMLMERFRPKR